MQCCIEKQLEDMGIPPNFGLNGLFSFSLKRDDGSEILVTVFRDFNEFNYISYITY
ncbi:hypothetical protein [Shewanella violacea]|uniref:hypothetical protein n=1 Tax=Shewanella violacea TaxID=60217 RepID=UPI0012F8706F|nr:hypothetical protein [Shewanella violacea]